MDLKNILSRGIGKAIEQQPDGTWIFRHQLGVVLFEDNLSNNHIHLNYVQVIHHHSFHEIVHWQVLQRNQNVEIINIQEVFHFQVFLYLFYIIL